MSALEIGREAIRQEARGLQALAQMLDEGFAQAVDLLASVPGRVICAGMGKSGHVARKVAATLASTGTPASFVHPAEAAHGDLGMLVPGDGLFVFSNSGLTPEITCLAARAQEVGAPLVLVSANDRDGLACHADALVRLPALAEAWERAPTTSTAMQMAAGDAVAVALARRRGFTSEDFRALHPGGTIGRAA